MNRADAERLSLALQSWMAAPRLSDADVAAAFVLGSLALRTRSLGKRGALAGPVRPPAVDTLPVASELQGLRPSSSRHCCGVGGGGNDASFFSDSERRCANLGDFTDLLAMLGPAAVGKLPELCRGYPGGSSSPLVRCEDIPIAAVFARIGLVSLSNRINVCIHEWLLGRRPCVLTVDRIPFPMEVLRMQAAGTRVVTMFTSVENLMKEHVSQLAYMSGEKMHSRDALDFLCHDLLHMELFVNSNGTYVEQVGLFSSLAAMNPYRFFIKKYCRSAPASEEWGESFDRDGAHLWQELQYCFSDMNTWVPHILAYLKAKWSMHFRGRHANAEPQNNNHCESSFPPWQQAFGAHWKDFLRELRVPFFCEERTLEIWGDENDCTCAASGNLCSPSPVAGPGAVCCCGLYKFWRKMTDSETSAVQAFFRQCGAAALASTCNTPFAYVCPS
jgi:hypothetical protein